MLLDRGKRTETPSFSTGFEYVPASARPRPIPVPASALSFKLVKVHFKSPSEHAVDLHRYPLEMQFEHDIDLENSHVSPALASNVKGIPQKMMVSAMVEAGQEHEFLKKMLNKLPKDEQY